MKILYDYKSRFLAFIETLSWIFIIFVFLKKGEMNALFSLLFLSAVLMYLFLKICSLKKWYRGHPRHAGIGMHFQRAIVGCAYILPLFAVFIWFGSLSGIIIVNLLLAFLTYVFTTKTKPILRCIRIIKRIKKETRYSK
jgi:uncharacterized membrane protein YqaE (UPF0057 family)